MARIALRRLDVSVVQLQLISRAGVPEGVENRIRKVCVPFQPIERISNNTSLARMSIIKGEDEITVVVGIS